MLDTIRSGVANAEWWDLVPAILGALAGAAAAAIPAYHLALRTSRETLERDRTARLEGQKAATLRGLVKTATIVNGIATLHNMIEELIAQADAAGHGDMDVFQKVVPIVGFTGTTVEFDAAEVSLFANPIDFDFLNDLLLLANRHSALEAGFQAYGIRRGQLTDQLSAHEAEGQVGTSYLTPEEVARYRPRMIELNALATDLRHKAAIDFQSALKLAEQFGKRAQERLSDRSFPTLSIPPAGPGGAPPDA